MESKLGLNFELVNQARASAAKVADDTQRFIDQHTTVTVERAVCRLLGIDGVNDMDVPMPNVVVDHLMANSILPMGAAWAIGNAMVETGKDPQGVAEAVSAGELDLSKIPAHTDADAVFPHEQSEKMRAGHARDLVLVCVQKLGIVVGHGGCVNDGLHAVKVCRVVRRMHGDPVSAQSVDLGVCADVAPLHPIAHVAGKCGK